MKLYEVPAQFKQPIKRQYPAHQRGKMIEEYAAEYFAKAPDIEGLTYLPIGWTGWFVNHDYGKDASAMNELRSFVKSIPSGKYFTIVQNDDGTLCDDLLHGRGCTIFGAGGVGDIPIPLLCDPHLVTRQNDNRFNVAAFVGSFTTHKIRKEMQAAIGDTLGYVLTKGNTESFRFFLSNSKFALCPRGYGKTSFRLYESIQLGCIPVYIYDDPWLPFKDVIDWQNNCVMVHRKDIPNIKAIIERWMKFSTLDDVRNYWKSVGHYFTLSGCCEEIYRREK